MHIDEDDLKFKKKTSQASRYGVMGLCLGKKLKDELDQYCEDRGIVKTKLIKALLRQYLKDKKIRFLKTSNGIDNPKRRNISTHSSDKTNVTGHEVICY